MKDQLQTLWRSALVLATAICLTATMATPAAAQSSRDQDVVVGSESPTDLSELQDAQSDETASERFSRQGDNFKSPKAAQRFERRQKALARKLAGAKSGKVMEIAKGQYVEMGLERNDRIFVLLVEYGEKASTAANVPTAPGPLHNQIPEPNRSVDNNTIWQADYNSDHYRDMYFNRMVDYFKNQSSGRYTVNGSVTEWVKVPFNGPRYGSNLLGDAAAWTLIADGINLWTQDQLARGKTIEEITAYLKTFDVWDRYDYDQDGNFDEPDGYIDHFQIVHSGAGEETGGGTLGADAIWSHRWQAWYNRGGVDGPAYNKDGGVQFGGGWGANPSGSTVGSASASVSSANPTTAATVTWAHPNTPTGIWVGDYTIQPENGGLGVFAHEYGHDLGLPDHYDTNSGNNSTGFWNIMSSGSYLGDGKVDIGSRPGDMSAWDKIQLGWSNYQVAIPGEGSYKLGPAETATKQAQALVVPLSPASNVFYLYSPAVGHLEYGTKAFWGGKGDLIDNSMTRQINVPAAPARLTMRLNYQIESNWDYAYVSVSTNGGTSWTNLAGTYLNAQGNQSALTTNSNPNGNNLGNGITGTTNGAWRLATFNMDAYAGQTVLLRLRYKTDEYTNLKGVMADEMALGTFTDGAEGDTSAWSFSGFKVTSGLENSNAPHYYIAEYRQYRQYDKGLQTGPYTFGFAGSGLPEKVAHYPYQDGMLVWYWDAGESNNNTSLHPGEGLVLPVDAHPEPLIRTVQYPNKPATTAPWSATVQSYDSTFGIQATDALNLPFSGTDPDTQQVYQFWASHPSLPANPLFNDANDYWTPVTPAAGVIVPKTGASIRVVNVSTQDNFMQVQVVRPTN